ncbi:O-succinylbenzoic acid--CoA ligase [Winogradskyella wandonensis]|uniref:O-succinylbenzoic acid--CoA ligase n=1 Tax=Winogradskyella wandonensis TaxID=1442586 RepID=A0A4R1KWG1_9FLAO|nr:AMP-binding protein [Winogradskyella wandonensis]TCK69040.1 O-succinylbenzoic acid--CoA ligase [Winogradskyella wandonensis]
MTPQFNKIHNRFKFNGHYFSHEELKEVAYSLVKEGKNYEQATGDFLLDWLNDNDYIHVNTSGSTGKPKSIKLQKQAMVHSAIATGNFFKLEPGNKALNCLPSHYIAGKMMLVRAMILGLEIDCVEPSTHPIFDYETQYDFSAMIPLQLKHVINYTQNIKTIIVGGSKITQPLLERIKQSTSVFYETYGMTETVTHVALKPLESKRQKGSDTFTALPEVVFTQDQRDCLVIDAPNLTEEKLITNDIVELLSSTQFKWLGRYDNVINSGGVKLFPEQIEDKLHAVIDERFIVASEPDDSLGEKLVLIIENPRDSVDSFKTRINHLKGLTKYEVPKEIYTVNRFLETANGKIQRKKTINSVLG